MSIHLFRCLHCPADSLPFLSLDAWRKHRRIAHNHHTGLPISSAPSASCAQPTGTPPAPVPTSGPAGGTFSPDGTT